MARKGSPVAKPTLPTPNPAITDQTIVGQFNDLNVALVRELDRRVQIDVAYDNLLLISPGGKAYKISVKDDGTLLATLMYQPPP